MLASVLAAGAYAGARRPRCAATTMLHAPRGAPVGPVRRCGRQCRPRAGNRARAGRQHRRRGAATRRHRAAVRRGLAPRLAGATARCWSAPGRLLPREDVLKAVKAALVAAGASPDCEVELPGFSRADGAGRSAARRRWRPSWTTKPASGRFSAMLSVTGDGMEPINLRRRRPGGRYDRVAGRGRAAWRPARWCARDDVRMARVHVAMVHSEVLHAAGRGGRPAAPPPGRRRASRSRSPT